MISLLPLRSTLHTLKASQSASGDLSIIRSFSWAELDLSSSKDLQGHIGNIWTPTSTKKLRMLKLNDTLVGWHISALSRALDLEELNISNSGVFGNIRSLRKQKFLKALHFENTAITGWCEDLERELGQSIADCSPRRPVAQASVTPE